ncbi:MAG: 50S ribosomal protein L31e [Candidatus Heimdallarchaeum aukensis]|uniref:Large ribosomal subunit protein eL31 n=1 Tax=Candidatus Heimdallarchaeum aukensis TaxID=2876573 RepID=A0A9Y1BKK1_9ARCH|nr:MAG: 50S ribosomal protein L31e [Candidatus Heimdallarchaeum aukensis]
MSQEPLEIIYTVPFFPKLNKTPRYKRAPRAIRLLKEYILKHTKADIVVIDNKLNEYIWERGIEKPPRRVKVRTLVEIEEELKVATVKLVTEKVEVEARPELEGITVPTELEEEEEEEEEEDNPEEETSEEEPSS